jgi:hypothetical protein
MTRLALALAVWITAASLAPATLTARRDGPRFDREDPRFEGAKLPDKALGLVVTRVNPSEYVVTEEAEVLLNGQPCRYQDVPEHATILRMELAWDNKTVLTVHFRAAAAPLPRGPRIPARR